MVPDQTSFTIEASVASRPPQAPKKANTFTDVYGDGVKQSFMTLGSKATGFKSSAPFDNNAEDEEGSLTVATATFNLANNIIGAGLVGLSYVGTGAGILPFLVLLTSASIGSIVTLDMITAAGEMAGWKDFERAGIAAVGNVGKWMTAIAVCANCYGACIAYLKLVDTTAPVVGKVLGFFIEPMYLQIGIAVGVVFPLCCLKSLNSLASSAMFALVVYMAVTFYTIYSGITDTWYADVGQVNGVLACAVQPVKFVGDNLIDIIRYFPTIIFAFVCHMTALPVFAELKVSTYSEMQKVNRFSILTAFMIYLGVSVSGYVAFTNNTFSSVLLNLRHCVCKEYSGDSCASSCKAYECADDNIVASILNACFLAAVITGYPSVHFSLRKSLITIFVGEGAQFSWRVHIGIAFINVAITLIIAILATDVSLVFNWSGSLASPMVAFVLPSLFFTKLVGMKGLTIYAPLTALLGTVMMFFGALMIIVGVTLQLTK